MPPQSPASKSNKFYFFYGHRKPSQNRPIVYGGLFSNRETINRKTLEPLNPLSLRSKISKFQHDKSTNFTLQNWYPDSYPSQKPLLPQNPSDNYFQIGQRLSPVARYICDSFRKHRRWGPPVVADLEKLRRVTPNLVAEVIKVQTDPTMSSKFFHWAGKQKGYQHNFASYNAFAYCLNRLNQFRAADQVPELMNMQGRPPTEKQFEILIRMHADNNRGRRVYYVYEKMKKFGVRPRVFLYNRIMDALVKTGHLELALSVYDDFKKDELVEESTTYMILVKGLCRDGRIDEMFDLLGQMRRNLCKPDIFAYTAMIRVLTEVGNLEGCLKVWEEMIQDKIEPDVMAYATVIIALCKGGLTQKAYDLFKEMKRKENMIDRTIYGSLIEAFVANGKVGSACDLWKDLTDSGYRADLSIFNSLIQGFCNVGRVDKAYKMFLVTVQEGLEPDFSTLSPMLVNHAESRKMDDFCSLLEQMQKSGLSVIDDLCKFFSLMVVRKLSVALEAFEGLKTKGYCSVPIYNILIEALYKNGEAEKALSFFHGMRDLNFDPDSSSYSHAIVCLVELNKTKEACLYYNKIKNMACVPSVEAYHSLVKGLCKIAELDDAMLLVRDCLANLNDGPIIFKYTLTVLHTCRANDAEKILKVIDEMVQLGCQPDDVLYCAVITGMCKHGTMDEASKVFSIMKERNLLTEASMIVYEEMLVDHMKKKTADLVVSGLKFFGLESKLKCRGCTLLST